MTTYPYIEVAMASSAVVSSEMFRIFAPSFYISRFFCIHPFKWERSGCNYVILKSKGYIAYSIFTLLFCVAASIYGLSQLYKLNVVYTVRLGDNIKRLVTFIEVALVLVPSVFGVVTASLKTEQFMNYLVFLQKFDCLIEKHPPKSWKYLFVSVTTISYTAFVLILDLVMWIWLCSREENIYVLLVHFFPYYFCYCFTLVIELVYWQCTHSIKVRMLLLNDRLRKYTEDAGITDFCTKVDRKNIRNITDTMKTDDSRKQIKHKGTLNVDEIRDLINAYQKLTEATDSVNSCYSLVIMIVILGCVIFLLVTPYALYSIINNTGNTTSTTILSVWIMGHILRLLLIIEPCHGCLVENEYTSVIVCKLLCYNLEDQVRQLLEFFLIYLAQCPIMFTAFGVTKIHRGLLATIAGAVTTYLVILFQFNKQ